MGTTEEQLLEEKCLIRHKEKSARWERRNFWVCRTLAARVPIPSDALSIISEDRARVCEAVFLRTLEDIHIACVDPINPELALLLEDLHTRYHTNPKLFLISPRSFELALKFYMFVQNPRGVKGIALTQEDLAGHYMG